MPLHCGIGLPCDFVERSPSRVGDHGSDRTNASRDEESHPTRGCVGRIPRSRCDRAGGRAGGTIISGRNRANAFPVFSRLTARTGAPPATASGVHADGECKPASQIPDIQRDRGGVRGIHLHARGSPTERVVLLVVRWRLSCRVMPKETRVLPKMPGRCLRYGCLSSHVLLIAGMYL